MAKLINHLKVNIEQAIAAIRQLQLPAPKADISARVFDTEQLGALLQQLLVELNTLNPESATPILEQLPLYLSQNELKAIHRAIDDFDFDGAKIEVKHLLNRLANHPDGEIT